MGVSEDVLIRILVGRSEKDLGDIVQYFAEANYGEGKTLKQKMSGGLKGSFKTALLRIADIADFDNDNIDDIDDYESQTESEIPTSSRTETPLKGAIPAMIANSKSAALPVTTPSYGNREITPAPPNIIQESESKSPKITITSPSNVEEEYKLKEKDKKQETKEKIREKSVSKQEESDIVDNLFDDEEMAEMEKPYDPYDINEDEFGGFIINKVNEKTAKRLMQHLKSSSKNNNKVASPNNNNNNFDDDVIKATQCIHVLLFACVLFLKYKEKTEKRAECQIDKKKLKKSLMPSYNWMLENKLNNNATLLKSKYKILGQWLKEFYAQKQK